MRRTGGGQQEGKVDAPAASGCSVQWGSRHTKLLNALLQNRKSTAPPPAVLPGPGQADLHLILNYMLVTSSVRTESLTTPSSFMACGNLAHPLRRLNSQV